MCNFIVLGIKRKADWLLLSLSPAFILHGGKEDLGSSAYSLFAYPLIK